FVEATRDPEWSRSRGDAFRDAVAETGLPFLRFSSKDGTYQASVASREEFVALAGWLASLPKPAAVFAATDERARDALLSCREAGLDVPRSLAILGVNNDEFTCSHIFPNLSSVALDQAALGHAAAEELHRLLRGGCGARRDFEVPVSGVAARESTAPPSPGGRLVGAAFEWMERNACGGANAAEVAHALGVSKSLLDLRFRELGAGTVHGALVARRLREVRRRLRETEDTIEEICGAAGFNDTSGLRRLFRARFGLSMRAWRDAPR
ncbi:MAG: substrate-binding domain-containing protein, partial [Kiritimatiellae bacterium]|nr:substrate-binding domain-containing protein [Kiritimatiellia bacterium]